VSLKYRRGDKVVEVKDLVLAGDVEAFTHPFLGILPLRDDPNLGVEIRHVYPRSPAEAAGLKPGDRIVKAGTTDKPLAPFTGKKRGRDELLDLLNTVPPDTEIQLEVLRDGGKKTDVVKVKLGALPGTSRANPDAVPERLPAKATKGKALDPLQTPDGKGTEVKMDLPKNPETGFFKRTTAGGDIKKDWKYWVFVHEDYDPKVAHALVVWLHPQGQGSEEAAKDFAAAWEDYCKDNHIILVGPRSDADDGWVPNDAEFILEVTREVMKQYNVDRQRVVAHGMGVGGQMAIHLGFAARDLFRGVATTGAVVTQPKAAVATQRLAFYLAAGDRDPLVKAVADCRTKLADLRLPAVYREIPERARDYLTEAALRELVRWIDTLDRQ
jgi:predicted esterase